MSSEESFDAALNRAMGRAVLHQQMTIKVSSYSPYNHAYIVIREEPGDHKRSVFEYATDVQLTDVSLDYYDNLIKEAVVKARTEYWKSIANKAVEILAGAC